MADIGFYHLTYSSIDRALPKLLAKVLQGGFKVLVLTISEEKTAFIDNLLWTYDPASFLPHGSDKDGNKELQPIYISDKFENPGAANVVVITDGVQAPIEQFERVIDIFDGNDNEQVMQARSRWKDYKANGHNLDYFQQSESGSWVKKATS